MPLYEYYCADCRTKFEVRRPMREADATVACKQCDSERTSRVLSLFATINSSGTSSMASEGMAAGGCCGGGSCGCRH
jgi:putative FmdB family regulatory protein